MKWQQGKEGEKMQKTKTRKENLSAEPVNLLLLLLLGFII